MRWLDLCVSSICQNSGTDFLVRMVVGANGMMGCILLCCSVLACLQGVIRGVDLRSSQDDTVGIEMNIYGSFIIESRIGLRVT
jgi:hypothetical protein